MTTTENDNLEENSAGAVSVSLNPGQTIGGIGDPVLPSAETVGSGDMLSVADIEFRDGIIPFNVCQLRKRISSF